MKKLEEANSIIAHLQQKNNELVSRNVELSAKLKQIELTNTTADTSDFPEDSDSGYKNQVCIGDSKLRVALDKFKWLKFCWV